DRIIKPQTGIAMKQILENDGWCDDDQSANYNRPVKLPYKGSHEKMARTDRLYDVCIVLDYNIKPVKRGKGSAIFFHQTSKTLDPTAGCIAINPDDMRRMLPYLTEKSVLQVVM
ncbi:MAG: L,D-transpeptidase family protein, partial [Pseudomonadota bacterium]